MATMLSSDPGLQRRLGEEVRIRIYRKVLYQSDRSLEDLQSLLIYAAWYCHYDRRDIHHQVFLVSQLCVTLAHDLGIASRRKTWTTSDAKTVGSQPSLQDSNAQKRAFLGTYCLSCL